MGIWPKREALLFCCFAFATAWIITAVGRFLDVVGLKARSKLQSAGVFGIIAVLVFFGVGLVVATGSFADNANAIRVCTEYAEQPESAAYKAAPCQRLYERRAERARRYMGE